MLLGFVLDVVISRLKVVVDDRVGSFTVEADFAIGTSKDDRHPFTDVVEIQNAEQFVDFRLSHCLKTKIHTLTMTRWEKKKEFRYLDCDGIWCSGFEDESEISGSRN